MSDESRGGPRYERASSSLEFDRVMFFSDAVFAIAMTLLVVGIHVPAGQDSSLPRRLGDLRPQIQSFFISFAVIGYYWLAHHRFVARLRYADTGFMALNLCYLAAIAFLPFPTALVGAHNGAPISVVLYAITLGVASAFEAVMLAWAVRRDLLSIPLPAGVFHWALWASVAPLAVFACSIPLAYLSPTWALLSWLLVLPVERLLDLRKPPETDELFGA